MQAYLAIPCQFLTLLESQQGRNLQKEKTFISEDFETGFWTRSWSHVKVIVHQEGNLEIPFGLKQLKFNTQTSLTKDASGAKTVTTLSLRDLCFLTQICLFHPPL